ncbi:MAG: pyruvate dehydrogenase (acetyl-transferring) E1 component subunit alpha [Anaerolineales bacterium]|nr:pyruvate dehydrogenase (acetyl-transferring) E1 component subunit alpha [Anaerolineales bacterium]
MQKEELIRLYHEMVLIRRVEERAAELYQQGKIGGFLHLYIGQEAVGSGVLAARKPQDRVITAYRDHGIAIASGVSARAVMAELLGKKTGTSKGLGGSMHMADVSKNYWGGHAIVGAHLPFASGMALADQYRGGDGVTRCFFGDGATNIGYFHEALNLAGVWKLPVVWICENNQYGMGTAVGRASAVEEIYKKADAYNTRSLRVEGMDVMQVYEAASEAIEYARTEGPFFLEVITYRFQGHSMGDPERYRTKAEVGLWQENDPIGIFRKYLVENKVAGDKVLNAEELKVEEEVQEAIAFAEASPSPEWQDLIDSIYVEEYRDE